MKSKAEIIDALERCRSRDMEKCIGCKYKAEGNECWHWLFTDLLELLHKSDYEVVIEVLDKSLILDWEHSEDDDYCRTKWLSAKDACGTVYKLAFDSEGNII